MGTVHGSDFILFLVQLAGKKVELPKAQVVSHEEVLAIGQEKAGILMKLVESIVNSL